MGIRTGRAQEPDFLGEKVTIEHGQNRREWLWFLDAADFIGGLPLYIQFCGNSIWDEGVSITRTNSRIYALELVVAGSIELVQAGRSYLVKPGEIFALRRGCTHSYRTGPEGFAHKRVLCIGGDQMDILLERMGLNDTDVLRPKTAFEFARITKEGSKTMMARMPGYERVLSTLAWSALLFAASEALPSRYPEPVRAALYLMDRSLGRAITLDELAKAAALSVPHLCRLFNQHFGKPPMVHFRSLKIRHARELLQNTTARIKEISQRLGYESSGHFTRVFAHETGMTPREFRKKHSA
jgi:AraC-like DNA-binding protein